MKVINSSVWVGLLSPSLTLLLVTSSIAQTLSYTRVAADVISFQGNGGIAYTIQTSTNLTNWNKLVELTGNSGGFHSYTNFPGQRQLFYRTVAVVPTNTIDVTVQLDPDSPLAGVIQVSPSYQTPVVLAVFDIESPVNSQLRNLSIVVNTTGVTNMSSLFTSISIWQGSTVLDSAGPSFDNLFFFLPTTVVTFRNLNLLLPSDNMATPIIVKATVAQDTNGVLDGTTAWASLIATGYANGNSNNPSVWDSYDNTLGVIPSTNTGSIVTFDGAGILVGNQSANLGSPIISNAVVVAYNATLSLDIIAGTGDVYINKDPNVAVSTSITDGATWNPSPISSSGGIVNGTNYFLVPSSNSATFTISGVITNTSDTSGYKQLSVTAVNWGISPSNLVSKSLTRNLNQLRVLARF